MQCLLAFGSEPISDSNLLISEVVCEWGHPMSSNRVLCAQSNSWIPIVWSAAYEIIPIAQIGSHGRAVCKELLLPIFKFNFFLVLLGRIAWITEKKLIRQAQSGSSDSSFYAVDVSGMKQQLLRWHSYQTSRALNICAHKCMEHACVVVENPGHHRNEYSSKSHWALAICCSWPWAIACSGHLEFCTTFKMLTKPGKKKFNKI